MPQSHKILRSFGTHDGSFHADEVTACALLLLFDLIDKDKIIRTRDMNLLLNCDFVCDVGGFLDPEKHLFDHHQAEYKGTMSSAGLLLSYLKSQGIVDENLYHYFNFSLFKGVDDHDNGLDPQIVGLCTYSHIITHFNPIHNDASPDEQYKAFLYALEFAVGHLKRLYQKYCYIKECKNIVEKGMESQQEHLLFEKSIPWIESFFELGGQDHNAKFVIMPSGNHWKLRAIPPTLQRRMEVRQPLPNEWAGLHDDDLKQASGIEGAVFCHKGRFISVWETKEDALRALEYTLKKSKGKR